MARRIVLLSGSICSGKSTLAEELKGRFDAIVFKTREWMREYQNDVVQKRGELQELGDRLDKRTKGAWVAEMLGRKLPQLDDSKLIVIDSVRTESQIRAVRQAVGFGVMHIHLHAARHVLADRYRRRGGQITEFQSYEEVLKNKTERQVLKLAHTADVIIDTQRCTAKDVLTQAASHLGLFGRGIHRLVDVIVGGQYGSEGKGHIASYLAPEYDILLRVGGPNAGHKVYREPDSKTFHSLPSGTFRNERAHIVIGAGAVINPPRLLEEISEHKVRSDRLSIDPQVMIITDEDIKREKSLVKEIGSTGQGVGAATARRIIKRSLKTKLAKHVKELRPFVKDVYQLLEDAFAKECRVLLEGTQGTALSLYHGDYPYVTSRDTTVAGCLAEAGIAPSRVRRIIMVCRTYPIRVESPSESTSGPLSQELSWEEISNRSNIPVDKLRGAERTSTTNKKRRVGEFDWHLLRKAATLNGPTDIALTFSDYLSAKNQRARRFSQLTPETIGFIGEVERTAEAPVSLISTRFAYRSIIDRRRW